MIIPGDKRVRSRMAISCKNTTTQTGYKTAAPGGPAGSATMTFGSVFTFVGNADGTTNQYIFARYGAPNGWYIYQTGNNINVAVYNVTPAAVLVAGALAMQFYVNTVVILIARYINGTLQVWLNGVSIGTTTLGTGYTSAAVATMIGTLLAAANLNAIRQRISECFMLDGYDVQASYNTAFGTGAAGWNAQIVEDLQQGRYLTWPRAAVANSDWYWSATDIVSAGGTCGLTWTDRYSATACTRTGAPQGASVMPRF